jgi:iron complex outermembrane receptor protein
VDFLFNDPVHSESKSGFLHTEFHVTNALTLTAGVRYTKDYKSYGFTRYFPPGYSPSPIDLSIASTNGDLGVFSGSRTDYRGTIAYQIVPQVNVYAEVATGFKGGGINGRPYYDTQVLPVAPETVKSYEVGVKSDLFDRHVRLNVAAFYNNYNAMQLLLSSCPQYVPAGRPQNCALPANVGNATIKGAELETEIHLFGNLLIDSSVSYLDFRFSSVDPATLVTLNDKPPFTPKYKLNAGIQYEFPLGRYGSLTPRFDYRYQAEEFSEVRNVPHGRIAPYGLANMRLTYRDPSDQWEIAARLTNAFAKYYYLTTIDQSYPVSNPASYDFASAVVGAPREWAVTVRRRF